MNIVFFTPSWPAESSTNGISTYCSIIETALSAIGDDVRIITPDLGTQENTAITYELDYKPSRLTRFFLKIIEPLNPGYRQYFLASRAIVMALDVLNKSKPIDVFEIEESFGWHRYIQRMVNFPVILRLHGPHYINGVMSREKLTRSDLNRIKRENHAIAKAKYLTAPCSWILQSAIETIGITQEHATVIFNPISRTPKEHRWEKSRIKRGQVLFVGRFDRHKGGDLMIDAFTKTLAEHPDATLIFAGPDRGVLVGNDLMNVNMYLEQFLTIEQRNKVTLSGTVDRAGIAKLRAESHVTVIASRNENFPYSGLEALASGSPLIASKVGGIAELFIDGISGLYFEGGNVENLAKCICRVLSDMDLASSLSKNASRRCDDIFDASSIALNTRQVYQTAINENN